MVGYAIVGIALMLFVQAKNVYPQLLFARLLFSIGGAATSTMVTAILPAMTASKTRTSPEPRTDNPQPLVSQSDTVSPSTSSQLTTTSARRQIVASNSSLCLERSSNSSSPARLAGLVGFFTGCGALLALGGFLPLPARFQRSGVAAGSAVAYSYYVVGTVSLVVSISCFVGLRNLRGEAGKGWRSAVKIRNTTIGDDDRNTGLPYWRQLLLSVTLGFNNPLVGLGYLGGFVARASSVGISLFIPLYVNSYFIDSGLCKLDPARGPADMKSKCPEAYLLSAKLTGVSQLIALAFAPVFGFWLDRSRHRHIPLCAGALLGTFGYLGFALSKSPESSGVNGSAWIYLYLAFLGISQIGAIVCSLGFLGRGILGLEEGKSSAQKSQSFDRSRSGFRTHHDSAREISGSSYIAEYHTRSDIPDSDHSGESTPLISKGVSKRRSEDHIKGSIAGVYSLFGGAGILLLTKLGGYLFDTTSSGAPFYILSLFNGILLVVGISCAITDIIKARSS